MARGRTPTSLDLPRPTGLSSPTETRSKQECIADAVREAILGKLLPAGSVMPSSRTLADRWQVSRGTVEAAFDRLCSEGYVERIHGSSTKVSAVVPDIYLSAPAQPHAIAARQDSRETQLTQAMATIVNESVVSPGVPFVARLADPTLLAQKVWKRHVNIAISGSEFAAHTSPTSSGVEWLRSEIASYLGKYRGIACGVEDVVITSGIRHAIDLFARAVLARGAKIFVEDPGYRSAHALFKRAGAEPVDIPIDAEGAVLADAQRHKDAVAIYVTPAHQSPLGITMAASRRLEILAWAVANHAWILEDDYDGEFAYQAAPLPAMKAIDTHDRVVYCGSFNKTVFSSLRVGFMVVPRVLRGAISTLLQTTGRSVGTVEQTTLASFIASGDFGKHLRTARHAYLQRRDAILVQLESGAKDRYAITGNHAGFHFVLWLPPETDEGGFVARAASVGLTLQGVQTMCRSAKLAPGIIIGYTALTLPQARYAGGALATLLKSF